MRADSSYYAAVILHLPLREMLRMTPGLFYDMVQIHHSSLPKKGHGDID